MQPPIYPDLELRQLAPGDLYNSYFYPRIGASALAFAKEQLKQHTVLDFDIECINNQGVWLLDPETNQLYFLDHDAIYDCLEKQLDFNIDAEWYDQWLEQLDLEKQALIEQAYWQEFYINAHCAKHGFEYLNRISK